MSNKLRSFITVLVSIVVVMAALPLNTLQVFADVYTISYSAGEGTGEKQTFNTADDGSFTVKGIDELNFTCAGHVFKCWKDEDSNNFTPGKSSNATKDINLTAQWVDAITITFDKNAPEGKEVTGSTISQVVGSGMSATLVETDFKCTGYEFLGWNLDKDATDATYSDKQGNINFVENKTLYAVWKKQIVVSFNSNGGSGSMDPEYLNQPGGSYNAPENGFTYNGFKFVDWRIGDDDSKHVNAGNSFDVNSDITLYATWQKYWIVSYDNNGGTGSISPEEVNAGSSTSAANPGTTITKEGYSFWKWKGNDDKYYIIGETITPDSNLTLTAQWQREITVYANDGVHGEGIVYCPVGSSTTFTNSITHPQGKSFLGWTTAQDSTDIILKDGDSLTITGNNSTDVKELYSQWGTTCDVKFDANDSAYYGNATGLMSDLAVGIGFTTALPACGFTRDGHTFAGWEVDSSVTGVTIDNTAKTIAIDAGFTGTAITLKAKWTPSTHTVTFKDDDGSIIASTTYNYGVVPTPAVPTKAPTKESVYTFAGWKDTSTEDKVYKNDELPHVTGAATYQATYTASPRPYTVSVSVTDTSGGSVEESIIKNYGEEATITVELQDGYHIEQWKITTGDTVVTNDPDNVSCAFTVEGTTEVIVTIAKNPHTVTVTYSEGGTASAPTGLVYGDEAQLSATASEGYRFVNWTNSAGEEVSTDPNYKFTVVTDVTLNANFALLSYDINLSQGEHGSVSGEGNFKHFESVKVTATPDNGYHFVNWTEDGTEVSASPEYTFTVTGARNLTANFAINSYAIDISAGKNGSVSGSESGTYNHFSSVTVTATPDKGYHFVNWTENGTEVSADPEYTFTVTGARNLKANFAINMYTVTYKNDDGTVLQQGEMPWGSTATYQHMANPTKKPTVQFTYTFAGWDNKDTLVTKDLTFTAVYTSTVNKYKITFTNEDGTVLQTSEVEYGKFPVYEKETPTKSATVDETFTFAGWDKEITKVTGEAVYKATYTSTATTKDNTNYKYFKVVFITNGGSEVVTQLVAEGGVAFKPEEPLRERYTFGGWYIDSDLTKPFSFATVITADTTLYAKWVKGSPEIEATYAVVGMGSITTELGSGEDITIAVERSKDNDTIANHFKGVMIDGVEVDYYKYKLADDNSSVIISADAIDELEAGTHTITIVYDDGKAEVELIVEGAKTTAVTEEVATETAADNVEPANNTPEEKNNTGLWVALGAVGAVVIAAIPIFLIIKRRGVK